jgi:hypothetical protein
MKYRTVKLLLGVVLLAGLASPLLGQVRIVESLEWCMADSDLVIHGTLTDVKRLRDKDETIWSTFTIKVDGTFKGERKDEIKFITSHKTRPPSDRLADLAENKAPVLVCLVKSDRYKSKGADYAEQPWALRLVEVGDIDHAMVNLAENSGAVVVTMAGHILTRKDDILKAAAAAGAPPAAFPQRTSIKMPPPAEVVRKLAPGSPVWLFVPNDRRLEAQGRSWLKEKEIELRVEGARLLRPFKSDDNVKLLTALLDDPQSVPAAGKKSFPLRKAAFDVLREWKIDVKMPVIEEP